jgi:hypothetical protein
MYIYIELYIYMYYCTYLFLLIELLNMWRNMPTVFMKCKVPKGHPKNARQEGGVVGGHLGLQPRLGWFIDRVFHHFPS